MSNKSTCEKCGLQIHETMCKKIKGHLRDTRLMNEFEKAEYYRDLLNLTGLTQTALAAVIGITQAELCNTIRMLKLPVYIREAIRQGDLYSRDGRDLLHFKNPVEREKKFNELVKKRAEDAELVARKMASSFAGG